MDDYFLISSLLNFLGPKSQPRNTIFLSFLLLFHLSFISAPLLPLQPNTILIYAFLISIRHTIANEAPTVSKMDFPNAFTNHIMSIILKCLDFHISFNLWKNTWRYLK